ncbi:DUF2062 domain-containing protein [bacterium]|nr:DUF2062 domain-containing protein [bacterium]
MKRIAAAARKFYLRFLRLSGEPRGIALGFALGLFIGMTPSIGFQMVIAAALAASLNWNKISAAMGVWITNPLTAPFIYSITYFVGSKIYGTNKIFNPPDELSLSVAKKILTKSPGIFYSLTIGGIVLGIPLAVAGYYISLRLLNRYQDDLKKKLNKQKEKLLINKDRLKEKVKTMRSKKHL